MPYLWQIEEQTTPSIFSSLFWEKNKIQGRLETRPPLPGQNKRIRPAATALEVRIHMNIHDTWLAYLDFYCVFVCEDQCLGGSNPTEQGGSLLADGSNQGWLPDTFQVGGCAFLKHLKESHIHTHTKKHKYTQISGVIICNAGFWSPSPGLSLWESHQQGTQVIFKHKNTHRLYSNTKTLRSISLSSLTLGGEAWQRGCCEAYSWNSEACSRHQIEVVFFIALLQFSAQFCCSRYPRPILIFSNRGGYTPLMLAGQQGKVEVYNLLLTTYR